MRPRQVRDFQRLRVSAMAVEYLGVNNLRVRAKRRSQFVPARRQRPFAPDQQQAASVPGRFF